MIILLSAELSGCDSNNMERASAGDASIPRWPFRFEAITKTTSSLRSVIESCNRMIFPRIVGILHFNIAFLLINCILVLQLFQSFGRQYKN